MELLTDEEARDYIASHDWIFATTYAETLPHEYIVFPFGDDDAAKDEFKRFIQWVRKTWNSKTVLDYRARALDGHQYWCIWPVVNRATWTGETADGREGSAEVSRAVAE